MARLCWTALVLAVFLSAQSGGAAVDPQELAELVAQLLNVYRPTPSPGNIDPPMFALAISIPFNITTNRYDFTQVTEADPPQNVKNALKSHVVYTGTRVVGARVRKINGVTEHAEYRVFENFDTLVNRINHGISPTDLMLFYVFKNPCDDKCANPNSQFSILDRMIDITRWDNYAVVFSKIFVPPGNIGNIVEKRREALQNIGNVINGVNNIYRCIQGAAQCIICDNNGVVDNNCIN